MKQSKANLPLLEVQHHSFHQYSLVEDEPLLDPFILWQLCFQERSNAWVILICSATDIAAKSYHHFMPMSTSSESRRRYLRLVSQVVGQK